VGIGRGPTNLGVGSGAEAPRDLSADIEFHVGVGHEEGLGIGVESDELHTADSRFDHAVHGIDAAPADSDDFDNGQIAGWLDGTSCIHEHSSDRGATRKVK
jgi:hypothetical protein